MSSATEELRRLLNERGVEWFEPVKVEGSTLTRWHIDGVSWIASEIYGRDNALRIVANTITPEQVIAATLGSLTCHSIDQIDSTEFFICSNCNYGSGTVEFLPNYCPNCGRRVK